MRDDGLFYPADKNEAYLHILKFIHELLNAYDFVFSEPMEEFHDVFQKFISGECAKADLGAFRPRLDAYFQGNINRKIDTSSPEKASYVFALVILAIEGAIDRGEVDIPLENMETSLNRLTPKQQWPDTQALWEKYFWP